MDKKDQLNGFPRLPLLTPAQNLFSKISQIFDLEMPGEKMHAQLRNRLVDLPLNALQRADRTLDAFAAILTNNFSKIDANPCDPLSATNTFAIFSGYRTTGSMRCQTVRQKMSMK